MGLFQNTVTKKYLLSQGERIKSAYKLFTAYFLNPDVQENIRNSKEEQFQEGFLRELFVKVLGYTLNPDPDYNLITEQKNEKDSKKADGAIIVKGEIVGVIELKDRKTIDLKQVETQAFGYKNNNRKASYVITSNFEKLRFYIDNAVDFEEFNLFTLDYDRFAILWLCLAHENIARDLPKHLKADSVNSENDITKRLYKNYSEFKRDLFADLTANNPQFDRLTIFKKSQKLLDRLLFILFAEDSALLPPNSVKLIVEQWEKLKEMDEYRPLYDRLKKYFGYMNTGHHGAKHEIFAYNGGLFKPDEVLDALKISDEVLRKHTLCISGYNFASEVDVNILGHIFENSLTEIEEITNAIEGKGDTAQTSKRKKDGIFYTPRYITSYIVENTLGRLCAEKKAELKIDESEYFADKRRQKATTKRLDEQLQAYRQWLLSLTICDPACGSGAFLNAALDFLMAEHRLIDEMTAKILSHSIAFPDIENAILENNLYGVDINEESVEIAKLALWLRTAKPHRKLNSLNDNIKCGNSLISDPAVAGDKAFDWSREFPQVFAKGGFDVVIGNPPYVLCQPSNTEEKTLNYYKTFTVASYKIDLFHLFFERGIGLLNQNGKLGFITPNTYLTNIYINSLRSFLLVNTIDSLAIHPTGVFEDAGVDVCTICISKCLFTTKHKVSIFSVSSTGECSFLTNIPQNQWIEGDNNIFNLNVEFGSKSDDDIQLGDIASITFGLQTKDKATYVKEYRDTDEWELCYTGRDVKRYFLYPPTLYFLNRPEEVKAGGSWNMNQHHSKKIVVRQVGAPEPIFAYDPVGYATLNTMYSIVLNNNTYDYSYIISILCSSFIKKWWLSRYADNKDLFPKIKGGHLKTIPIKDISLTEQQPFIDLADKILTLNAELQTLRSKFLRRLQDNFEGIKITGAIERFDTLDFAAFVKELSKQKIKLSLKQQDEWEEYFNDYRTQCTALSAEITATDQTIDKMVYELYGLTEEEIEIIEKN